MIVDDSIVRGSTMQQLVAMLFDAGASEVHVRVSSPPIVSPCFYGIDMADEAQLAAAHRSVEQMRELIGATSLHYLSLDAMQAATRLPEQSVCRACFTRTTRHGAGGAQPRQAPLRACAPVKVVSVNAGRAEPMTIGGRTISTGIRKAPVGRGFAGPRGLGGDAVVDEKAHGGLDQALYLYSCEDYAWWGRGSARHPSRGRSART